MAETKRKKSLWNFIDNLQGDKVVWMIVLLLILISIVAIFSSTSQLASTKGTTRMHILTQQMIISLAGLGLIIVCYSIRNIGFFKFLSQFGYALSISLLLVLVINKPIGPFHPIELNQARRVIAIGGFQLHVFEVTKVAMIMYLAWAVTTYKNDKFWIANKLAEKYPIFKKDLTKKIMYLYIPIFSVCICMMVGSLSSTLFVGGIMFVTILIGGIKVRDLIVPGLAAVGVLCLCIAFNAAYTKPDGKKVFPHLTTALKRFNGGENERNIEILKTAKPGSEEFQHALDKVKQPVSAKIAIQEGGLIGKGSGNSSQRYAVAIMFEDYMFSFIIEEYGLLGGIIVIILYISLLARGALIARNCDNLFAKTAVAGLVIMITGQAMMHIMVNCDIGPHTGQTLPLISHGNSSFLMFSLAFGILLSISKMARRKIESAAENAEPLVTRSGKIQKDEMESTLDDLDNMESASLEDDLDSLDSLPEHENDIPDYGIDDHNNE